MALSQGEVLRVQGRDPVVQCVQARVVDQEVIGDCEAFGARGLDGEHALGQCRIDPVAPQQEKLTTKAMQELVGGELSYKLVRRRRSEA